MAEIHAIILTFNEEKHISRCIKSLGGNVTSITVIDSESTDNTVKICESMGALVVINKWVNYATQLNFGIDLLSAKKGWLLRIDADEVLVSTDKKNLFELVTNKSESLSGILINRRIHFMGKRIKYGSIEPSWQLRLWRNGEGYCESRWMDEHVKVSGGIQKSNFCLSDINLNSLSWWTQKHNSYASREAIDALNKLYSFLPKSEELDVTSNSQAKFRRYLKEKFYLRIPQGIRSPAYFFYRYFLRLGFLDGKKGLYFHLLQGLWYRTLVDAKIDEIRSYSEQQSCSIVESIEELTGINPLQ